MDTLTNHQANDLGMNDLRDRHLHAKHLQVLGDVVWYTVTTSIQGPHEKLVIMHYLIKQLCDLHYG